MNYENLTIKLNDQEKRNLLFMLNIAYYFIFNTASYDDNGNCGHLIDKVRKSINYKDFFNDTEGEEQIDVDVDSFISLIAIEEDEERYMKTAKSLAKIYLKEIINENFKDLE